MIAREKGLEPLADIIMGQDLHQGDPLETASAFINEEKEITTAAAALAGAMDIIAETVTERADIRAAMRKHLWVNAELATELAVPESEAKDVLTYKEYREPVKRMPSHRILAVNRGEDKELLKVTLVTHHEDNINRIAGTVIVKNLRETKGPHGKPYITEKNECLIPLLHEGLLNYGKRGQGAPTPQMQGPHR